MHTRVRTFALVAVAACVLAALAGCSAPATQPDAPPGPTFLPPSAEKTGLGFGAFQTMRVTSFDGTELQVDLQFPQDGACPCPTLLTYTPYSVILEGESDALETELGLQSPFAAQFADEYVPHSYVVGVAHVRGTGESGGCLTVGGPEEGKDGYAIVEAIANQSWSNGKVALGGTSWDGTTPLETAVLQPPHLAAVVAISPVTSWYRYYFELGAHRRNGDTFPGSSDTDPAFDAVLGGTPGVRTLTVEPTKLSCVAEFAVQDDLQDDFNAYWKARDHGAHAANITAPVLYAQGWFDENVATTMIPAFLANLDQSPSDHHAWLEQHAHGVPGSKTGFYKAMHRFLDHYTLGLDTGAQLEPKVVIEDNLHQFRTEASWPPADAAMLRFNLTSDNTLTRQAATGHGSLSYTDLGLGYESSGSGAVGEVTKGAAGQATSGVDHLDFVSDPLPATHLAGVAQLHLSMGTNMPDTHVDALLYEVAPDGTNTFLTRGYLDYKHRDSLESASPVGVNVVNPFTFDLHPRDHRMADGARLHLVVKSTDDYVVRSPFRAVNTLTFEAGAAWLDMPVVSDAGRSFSETAPGL